MYSYEDRIRAVELYIKLGKRVRATIRQLGYPTKNALGSRFNRRRHRRLPRWLRPWAPGSPTSAHPPPAERTAVVGLDHVQQTGVTVGLRRKGRIGALEVLAEGTLSDLAFGGVAGRQRHSVDQESRPPLDSRPRGVSNYYAATPVNVKVFEPSTPCTHIDRSRTTDRIYQIWCTRTAHELF